MPTFLGHSNDPNSDTHGLHKASRSTSKNISCQKWLRLFWSNFTFAATEVTNEADICPVNLDQRQKQINFVSGKNVFGCFGLTLFSLSLSL